MPMRTGRPRRVWSFRQRAFSAVLFAVVIAGALSAAQSARATYPGTTDGRLAFGIRVQGNVDVHSVMPDGQALRRLTEAPGFDACPAYSASGKEITFCSNRSGTFEIWLMKQNGQHERQVTRLGDGGFAVFPDFSPDGSKIAFMGNLPGQDSTNIFVVDRDGSGLVQLTGDPGNDELPVYSPDGTKIVFVSDRPIAGSACPGLLQVWVMNSNGSSPMPLTTDCTVKDQLPDWRPDGSKIAYAACAPPPDGPCDIWVMNANGTGQTNLTQTPSIVEFGTAWSPDGARIAFVRDVPGPDRLVYVMNADGTGAYAPVPTGVQLVPGWQPRGGRIDH